ncbi:MAG: c-type cytochrome [Parachlamydiaceae bacterium]|nr:c-type cytochrome [Parachlamydiaceae bacterium]
MRKFFLIPPLFLILSGLGFYFYPKDEDLAPYKDLIQQHDMYVIQQGDTTVGFNLVDPEQAPSNVRSSVMRGYQLMMNTSLYAPNYSRDQLSCTNCHFLGGDTLGGKDNGISLVGVTNIFPKYSKKHGKDISLVQRINDCFSDSMSGTSLPEFSSQMTDIVAYLKWISKEVKEVKNIPWLGIKLLKSDHEPNADDGAQVYSTYCASCHKQDGIGGGVLTNIQGKTIPPIWGPDSYNDAAGLSEHPKLAAFIYLNMPYQDSQLTKEQALDVAAFVLKQPRPHHKE